MPPPPLPPGAAAAWCADDHVCAQIAKYIVKKGRVSIADLAAESNRLIDVSGAAARVAAGKAGAGAGAGAGAAPA